MRYQYLYTRVHCQRHTYKVKRYRIILGITSTRSIQIGQTTVEYLLSLRRPIARILECRVGVIYDDVTSCKSILGRSSDNHVIEIWQSVDCCQVNGMEVIRQLRQTEPANAGLYFDIQIPDDFLSKSARRLTPTVSAPFDWLVEVVTAVCLSSTYCTVSGSCVCPYISSVVPIMFIYFRSRRLYNVL